MLKRGNMKGASSQGVSQKADFMQDFCNCGWDAGEAILWKK
jgi:hypothetical protein